MLLPKQEPERIAECIHHISNDFGFFYLLLITSNTVAISNKNSFIVHQPPRKKCKNALFGPKVSNFWTLYIKICDALSIKLVKD